MTPRRSWAAYAAATLALLGGWAASAPPAAAYSFVGANGVLMGTVCRHGADSNVLPITGAMPVGQSCQINDSSGNFLEFGVITGE